MDPETFEAQLPRELPALRSLARRLLGNRDDAEDLVQEALLKASQGLSGFRGDASLKTWLFSIVTRLGIDKLRTAKRWQTQALVEACDERGRESVGLKFADPSISFDVQQHIAFCFTCVGRSLDPRHQAALLLREVYGLENAEAAQAMELTEPTYRHALAEGRATMKAEYDGLCSLVNKRGACYQCRALREASPEGRKGPALPEEPLAWEERFARVRAAGQTEDADPRLNDYFFDYVRKLQPRE